MKIFTIGAERMGPVRMLRSFAFRSEEDRNAFSDFIKTDPNWGRRSRGEIETVSLDDAKSTIEAIEAEIVAASESIEA